MIEPAYGYVIGRKRDKRAHQAVTVKIELVLGHGKAHVLRERMHTRVGTTGTGELDFSTKRDLECAAQFASHGPLGRLLGKTSKSRTAIPESHDERTRIPAVTHPHLRQRPSAWN